MKTRPLHHGGTESRRPHPGPFRRMINPAQTSERRKTIRRQTLEDSMFHLIWYVLIGLISGYVAKSVMHVHMTMFWTIVLGIIGSILGGAVTQMFSRPSNQRYHPAGLIFSTLGAILVLFICFKLNIHFPAV